MRKFSLTLFIFIAILSLLILIPFYFLTRNQEITKISQIDESWVGKVVTITGKIAKKKITKNGHVFVLVENEGKIINVPLFRSFIRKSNLKVYELKIGRKILVKGVVKLYKNYLQIVPSKKEDVKLL